MIYPKPPKNEIFMIYFLYYLDVSFANYIFVFQVFASFANPVYYLKVMQTKTSSAFNRKCVFIY